jgi:predicted O-methyltransferase YrrM
MKNIDAILEEAYSLYMPQEREEIKKLAEFVRSKDLQIIVEIGTKFGGTFLVWCEISKGKKISIDLVEGIHGGVSRENTEKRNMYFKERYPNQCFFIEGNSHDQMTLDLLIKELNNEKIDFLFIDGDHTYEGVKQDYEMYSDLVKPGGYIAFHDINDTERHRKRDVFVGKLWKELVGNKIEFNVNSDWAGIGVIQKPF